MLYLNVDRGGLVTCLFEYLNVGGHNGYKYQMTTLDSRDKRLDFPLMWVTFLIVREVQPTLCFWIHK